MTDKIKFVIIGSGNIANTYISAIQKIEKAEVTGIISRSSKKPSQAEHLPVFHSLQSVTVEFDAVIVCTPNGYHHISTIEAAELGKHVLCEKPIDITTDAIDDMISACKQNNVKLGVAYQRRYSSDNPVVKALIENGSLGKIFSVDLSIKNYRDDSYYNSGAYRGTWDIDGGGPFIQQASHYIDLYYWFFGRPEKLVSTLGTFVHDIEVEDHGAVICVHQNGMISTITASTATKPGFPAKLEIYSDKGYLVMENDVITQWEMEDLENPSVADKSMNGHTGSATAVVNDTSNHELIIQDFVEAVFSGKEPLITGESARNATEIILDIYKNRF
ncbi:Gfo/Idh/MocA family protein [Saccharicrinis sp. FJH62]|uniref:Gfo/Idh/MocA family protein n=1 Tax=Saccharicrinis sp. FJH62 TaxID=3344657 RepID=UPI0035D4EACA